MFFLRILELTGDANDLCKKNIEIIKQSQWEDYWHCEQRVV